MKLNVLIEIEAGFSEGVLVVVVEDSASHFYLIGSYTIEIEDEEGQND